MAHSIKKKVNSSQRVISEGCEIKEGIRNSLQHQVYHERNYLKRCDTLNSLSKKQINPKKYYFSQLEKKYAYLEEDYHKMANQVKNRIELYGKQKEEIDKLTRTMQQEEKEIKRLTQMLKMTHKQDLGVQTESIDEDQDQELYENHQYSGEGKQSPLLSKQLQASTGQSDLTSQTRCGGVSQLDRKQSHSKIRENDRGRLSSNNRKHSVVNNSNRVIVGDKGKFNELKEGKTKEVPLQKKYKFVPTLTFKHL